MKITILKAMHLLLRAGYSVSDAISLLNQQFQLKIKPKSSPNMDPLCEFVRSYFPIWCKYPYATSYCPIDAVLYVELCLQMIYYRREQLTAMVKLLWYPLLLLAMAILMGMIVVHSLHSLIHEPIGLFRLYGGFFLFLGVIIMYICWLIRSCIQLTPIDWLVVVDLHLSNGWLLGQVIRDLTPCGRLLLVWQSMIDDIIETQSFTGAILNHFKIDLTLVSTLQTFETTGKLSDGLHAIVPELSNRQFNRLSFHMHVIRCLLYLFIVAVIFTLLWLIYRPIINQQIM